MLTQKSSKSKEKEIFRYYKTWMGLCRFVATYVSVACRIDMEAYQRNLHIQEI
jgi:hypothetical protein